MKRLMVLMGLGFLLLATFEGAAFERATVQAEVPRIVSRGTLSQPAIAWHDDLQSGWQESRRRGVPMVIFITSETCSYCELMKRETWRDASIRQRIAKSFVAIRLSPRRNAATLNRIKVNLYPTTLVGAPRGKVTGHRLGYQPPAALHQLLTEAKDHPRILR